MVLGGVSIGDGAIVGAGSVVTKDVAPYTVVAGNPAVLRKQRFEPELRERLMQSRWWRYDMVAALQQRRVTEWSDIPAILDIVERNDAEGRLSRIPDDSLVVFRTGETFGCRPGQPQFA